MKSNKIVKVLAIIAVILFVVLMGTAGLTYYKVTHVFVEGQAYPKNLEILDLTQEEISFEHYDSLHRQLPDCKVIWNVPFQGKTVLNNTENLVLTSLTEEDIEILVTYLKDLKTVNATDCPDYGMLELLKAQLPEVKLTYNVSLGGMEVDPETDALVLNPEDFEYDTLMENLPHLHNVKTIQLRMPDIDSEQVDALRQAFPEITVTCTVNILGTEYDTETTELDLSELNSQDVDTVAERLGLLPNLETVELNDAEGNARLSMEEVRPLVEAAPDVKFHFTFDFYGQEITTTDEEVKVRGKRIGDEGEANVRLALDLMQNCKRFMLVDCRLSNEVLAQIRDDYRDKTKVVWQVYFGNGVTMTDAEVLRCTYDLNDDNSKNLIYLEDVRYIDLGHNEYLDNVPFVAGMKSLEVAIVAGAPIHDLTPFENCPNLKILELANCMMVPDLEPLAKCTKLEMLNIGFTKISDLSPLDDLPLTYLSAVHSRVSPEEQERFQEVHPDCVTTYHGSIPYGRGWRYDNNDQQLPWYKHIAEVFRYPDAPNNVGWYLDNE